MPRPRRVEPLPPSSTTLPSFAPTSFYSTPASSSQRDHRPELRVLLYDQPRYRVQTHSPRPPPTPISLVPPHNDDYGAFIVDKVVTPLDWGGPPAVGTAADLGIRPGEDGDDDDGYNTDEEEAREDERYRQDPRRQHVKRVLNYVVGWPDEPYARQLVPCTQILDYVSPRVVEDWEYALAERQRAAREARRAEKAAKNKGAQGTLGTHTKIKHDEDGAVRVGVASATAALPHKRTPGRPPQTAAATAARVAAAAARKAAAQGLPSTPAKMAKMAPTPGGPADRSTRPGSGSLRSARSTRPGLQIQLDSMPASTPMTVSIGGPPPRLFSSPGSAERQHAGPSLKRPFQMFVEQQKADESESRGASLGVDTATTTTTNASAIEEEADVVESDEGRGDENDNENEKNEENEENDDDALQGPATRRPHAMVMLPSLRETPPVQHKPSPQRPPPRPSTYIPPPDTPLYNPPMDRPQSRGPALTTPIPPPPTAQPQASLKRKRNEETPIPPPTIPAVPHPAKASIAVLPMPGPAPAPKDDEADDLYEVDRLEGDCLTAVDEDGNAVVDEPVDLDDPLHQPPPGSRVVRLFLVRWKGDWPPDQNPTWEPAENLPPRMVRQYLKRAAHKQARRDSKGASEQRVAHHSVS